MKESIQFNTTNEAEIWLQLKENNIDALGYFYQTYYTSLFLYGRKFASSPEIARDAIQDLFLRIWKKRKGLAAVTACRAYLFKSYRRILIDKLGERRKSLISDGDNDPGDVLLSVEEFTIQEEVESQRHQLLEKGLAMLTKKQNEILYLRFYRDMSYQDISDILGINNQSVRNSVHNSLKILKKSLLFVVFSLIKLG